MESYSSVLRACSRAFSTSRGTSTTPVAPTSGEVKAAYRMALNSLIASGEKRPLVLSYLLLGLFVLVAYLAIPHTNRPWLYKLRWLVMAGITAFELNVISETRSMTFGTGFGIGLASSWLIAWSGAWLIWNDTQRDVKRINRRRKTCTGDGLNGSIASTQRSDIHHAQGDGLRQRQEMNGKDAGSAAKSKTEVAKHTGNRRAVHPPDAPDGELYEYYWESYPTDGSLYQRLDWIFDLVLNFRGPGWSWAIHSMPTYPPHVALSLGLPVEEKHRRTVSSAGIRRYTSRQELFRTQFPKIVAGYLLLDFYKVMLMKDPFFVKGPNTYPLPWHLAWMPPMLLSVTRQLLTGSAILIAIGTMCLIPPLAICLFPSPSLLGVRGEVWMYPSTFGSLEPIFSRGLSGLWSSSWHQTFRVGFSAPTQYLIDHKILNPKARSTMLVGMVIAFGISGGLHAAGSITQFQETKPLGMAWFFLSQVLGITIQTWFCATFKGDIKKSPMAIRRVANVAFAFIWLYNTAPFLVDDMARGGIWLFEPVPFSPLKALGFGQEGDTWNCVFPLEIGWHKGSHWWETGITI